MPLMKVMVLFGSDSFKRVIADQLPELERLLRDEGVSHVMVESGEAG